MDLFLDSRCLFWHLRGFLPIDRKNCKAKTGENNSLVFWYISIKQTQGIISFSNRIQNSLRCEQRIRYKNEKDWGRKNRDREAVDQVYVCV